MANGRHRGRYGSGEGYLYWFWQFVPTVHHSVSTDWEFFFGVSYIIWSDDLLIILFLHCAPFKNCGDLTKFDLLHFWIYFWIIESQHLYFSNIALFSSSFSLFPFSYIFRYNGLFYFQADDCIHGFELWYSNGFDTNTEMLLDLRKGTASSFPSFLTVLPSKYGIETLLFSASDGYFNMLPNDKDGKYSNCWNIN